MQPTMGERALLSLCTGLLPPSVGRVDHQNKAHGSPTGLPKPAGTQTTPVAMDPHPGQYLLEVLGNLDHRRWEWVGQNKNSVELLREYIDTQSQNNAVCIQKH